MKRLQKIATENQRYLPYIVLIFSLVAASLIRWYYTSRQPANFFGLSFTDIANTHSRFLGTNTRFPYISFDLEYPVVLGFFFYLTGVFGAAKLSYFYFINSFLLSVFAIFSLWLMSKIHRLASGAEFTKRALIFWSLAPSILLFTTYNWDLLAVLLMLLAIFFLLEEKTYRAMVFLSLGAFTKMFPGFLLLPFLIFVYKKWRFKKALQSFGVFLLASAAINLPVMLKSFSSWSYFFRFSAERGAFGDNIWAALFVLRDKIGLFSDVNLVRWVGLGSLGIFGLFYLLINYQYLRSKSDVFLQSSFLSILAYLVTAKTTSAPFSLWVLPFFVLIPVNIWFGLIAEWANAFVYYAFFQHIYYNDFLRLSVSPGHYFRLTYIGVVLREVGLLAAGLNYVWRLQWIKRFKKS